MVAPMVRGNIELSKAEILMLLAGNNITVNIGPTHDDVVIISIKDW